MSTRILIGYVKGVPVYLSDGDLITHIHGMGLSRSGKSMLILYICYQLIKAGKPLVLIDPHGSLYRALVAWMMRMCYKREIVLFDPSNERHIVGLNPYVSDYKDESRLMTKAERLVSSTLRIWGAENPNQYSNIERWLRCIYYVLLEQQLSVGDIRYFIYWKQKAKRDELIDKLRSEAIKDQLQDFYSNEVKFKQDIESTRNKLQKFIHPQMRRIMGLPDNNINFNNLIEKKRILLCNFQAAEDELIGLENNRVLGTLLISELWEAFRKRTKPQEFYLIIDECHQFIGPDIQQILNEAAKRGLHLMLFHQHEGQIKDIAGAMKNAQTKIIFSTEDDPKEQRHFTLRKANHERIECEAPEVKDHSGFVSQERIDRFTDSLTMHFLTGEQVDEKLNQSHNGSNPDDDEEPNPYE